MRSYSDYSRGRVATRAPPDEIPCFISAHREARIREPAREPRTSLDEPRAEGAARVGTLRISDRAERHHVGPQAIGINAQMLACHVRAFPAHVR